MLHFARRLLTRGLALQIPQIAGSLAFLSLFAFVPVTVLTLAVMTALPAFARWQAALQSFLAANVLLPEVGETIMGYVNQFAAKAGGLSLMGLAVFLATAITSLFTIERTLNAIWQARPRRAWYVRAAIYWTLLTMAPLLLGASLALESQFWALSLSLASELEIAQKLWYALFPWLLTGVGLLVLYRFLPGTRVRWSHAAFGAFVAAAFMQGWKALLGLYLARFPTYTIVYGAFAALPAFLSWLFALWLTVLVGALLAAEARWWRHPWVEGEPSAPARRFDAALRVLRVLCRAAGEGRGWLPVTEIARDCSVDADMVAATGELLEDAGYLRRLLPASKDTASSGLSDECWVLTRPAGCLTLRALHDALWHGVEQARRDESAGIRPPDPAWLARPLDQALAMAPSAERAAA